MSKWKWSEGTDLFSFINETTRKRMIEFEKTKSLPITKEMVWEAYL